MDKSDAKRATDLRDRIAAVLLEHWPAEVFRTAKKDAYIERIADAVIAALGLESQAHYDPDCPFYRYVTDWIDPLTGRKVYLP